MLFERKPYLEQLISSEGNGMIKKKGTVLLM